MNANRKTAALVGILFIIGTAAGVLSVLVTQPVLSSSDYLAKIAANESRIAIGALLVLTMGLALALVPALLYPVFKQYNEPLAMGYVIFRGALEMVCYIATAICWLFLIIISQEYAAVSTAGATASATYLPYLQTLGTLFHKGNTSISNILIIIFSLDALMLYTILYTYRLVPRWISVWGFIAILLHFSTAFIHLFHLVSPEIAASVDIVNLPILLQEMVMAVWLIVKGFNPSAAPQPARQVVAAGNI